jgi:hypothetical protein
MAGRKGPKAVREKIEASKIGAGGAAGGTASTAAEAAAVATVTEPVTLEPGGSSSQLHEEQSASPRGHAETSEGEVQEVDEEEADEDEEDGEITDQARELRRLEHTSRTSQGFRAVNNLQELGQPAPEQAQPSQAQFNPNCAFDANSHGNRGGRCPRGGHDNRGKGRGQRPPYCAVCGENAGHITRDCKYNKMAKELKERDETSRGSEAPKYIYHNAPRLDNSHSQFYGAQSHYPTGCGPMQQPAFSQNQTQPPFAWQHQVYQPYQQLP